MSATFTVDVNKDILEFAIRRSGYSVKELFRKISNRYPVKYFDLDYLEDILTGKEKPKYSDLKKIDSFLKRGIPFYFLENVPDENIFIDFRRKYADIDISPEMEIKFRDYQYLREEIKELLNLLNYSLERIDPILNKESDPVETGMRYRNIFNLVDLNIHSLNSKELFEYFRKEIEKRSLFVFKNDLGDIRGCLFIGNSLPPLIVINSSDDKNAEIFSLLHDFGHYLLNDEEIETSNNLSYKENTERWCNIFAYSLLMKEEDEDKEGFHKKEKEELIEYTNLQYLSEKYKISKQAFMYRFLILQLIDHKDYFNFSNRYHYKNRSEKKPKGGNYYATERDRMSRKLIEVVYNNYVDGNISLPETFHYFKVKNETKIDYFIEAL